MTHDTGRLVLGRYRLLQALGEGGMGTVWHAHDERLGREVALKQLRLPTGLQTGRRDQLVARAQREARAAGMLKHPGIVTVYDQFDENGLPWIVLELVRGRSLAVILDHEGPLDVARVAWIGAQIASALAAAHRAQIVHRDIKPANILLEDHRAVVTDFGIAAMTGAANLTTTGALIGTPAYMSPEQVNDREATAASDMWSLGATLYTAVEGRPAFTGLTTAAVLLAIAQARPAPFQRAGRLTPLLGDLLHPDPRQRPTAEAAAAALNALAGTRAATSPGSTMPAPRPPSRRSSRRSVLIALGATGVAAAIPAGYLLARDQQRTEIPQGRQQPDVPRWNRTPTFVGPPLVGQAGSVDSVAFGRDGAILAAASNDHTVQLWDVSSHTRAGGPLSGHSTNTTCVAFSPDGAILATTSDDKTTVLWDVAKRTPIGKPLTGHTEAVWCAAFSRDGAILATTSWDKTAQLWDVAKRTPIGKPLTGHTEGVAWAAFSPDGAILATAGFDRTVRLWDVAKRTPLDAPLQGHADGVTSVAFSPDGATLATTSYDKTAQLWDVAKRTPIGKPLTGHTEGVTSAAFSPDGATLATASEDRTAQLWDVDTHAPIGDSLKRHTDSVEAVAFSPDGKTLATSSSDATVLLWRP